MVLRRNNNTLPLDAETFGAANKKFTAGKYHRILRDSIPSLLAEENDTFVRSYSFRTIHIKMTCDYSVIRIISPAIVQTYKVGLVGKVHEQNYNASRCGDKPRVQYYPLKKSSWDSSDRDKFISRQIGTCDMKK